MGQDRPRSAKPPPPSRPGRKGGQLARLDRARRSVLVRGDRALAGRLTRALGTLLLDGGEATARQLRQSLRATWPKDQRLVVYLPAPPGPEIEGVLFEALHGQVHGGPGEGTARFGREHRLWVVCPVGLGPRLEPHLPLRADARGLALDGASAPGGPSGSKGPASAPRGT